MQNYRLDFTGEQINSAIKYQSNYNYLLNPTFTINQRGETTYSGQVYSLDRWYIGDISAGATQVNNVWKFLIAGVGSNEPSSRIVVKQIIENYSDFAELKVTASIKYSLLTEDVSGTTQLSVYDGVNETVVDIDSTKDMAVLTHTVNANPTTLEYRIKTKATGTNVVIAPVYCKLEIGEKATINIPRANGEELWLCQRYFQKLFLDGQTGNYATSYVIQPLLILPNTLRTTPTITVKTFPFVYGDGTRYNTTNLTFKKMQDNYLIITLKTGNNSTTLSFSIYDFYCLKSGELTLDAEIH